MLHGDTFPLSAALVERMAAWNEFYETYNTPDSDEDANDDNWATWEIEGRAISADVQIEIGPGVRVYFYLDDQSDIPPYDPSWIRGRTSGSFTTEPRQGNQAQVKGAP